MLYMFLYIHKIQAHVRTYSHVKVQLSSTLTCRVSVINMKV